MIQREVVDAGQAGLLPAALAVVVRAGAPEQRRGWRARHGDGGEVREPRVGPARGRGVDVDAGGEWIIFGTGANWDSGNEFNENAWAPILLSVSDSMDNEMSHSNGDGPCDNYIKSMIIIIF